MVFEIKKELTDLDYERKGVHVNSIEFNNNNKMITIRTGKEFITDADLALVTNTYKNNEFLIHVSTSEDEYIFSLYKYATGLVEVTRYKTGDTNEYVYVFEGVKGQILEVEYAVNMTPENWKKGIAWVPITETFGQIYCGYYRRAENNLPAGAVFGTFLRTPSVISLEETSQGALSSIVPSTVDITTGFNDSYFNPFLDSSLSTSAMKNAFYNKYFGGGMFAVRQFSSTTFNEAKFFVGKWI